MTVVQAPVRSPSASIVRAASGIDEWTKPAALARTRTRRGFFGVAGAVAGSAAIICIRSVVRATWVCGPRGACGPRAGGGPCGGVVGAALCAESAEPAPLVTSASIKEDAASLFMTDTYTAHAAPCQQAAHGLHVICGDA
jgi:hypothetical protein